MTSIQALTQAVTSSLQVIRNDDGEHAASIYMDLARQGIDLPLASQHYPSAVNHAAIADIATTVIRHTEPWSVAPDVGDWKSSCLMHDGHLRRFLPVSYWNTDREMYERRSWKVLGEIAHHRMPMQMICCVIGNMSGGRRTGYWSKGLLHPQRSVLRFKRRRGSPLVDGFRDTWIKVYREDCEQISRAYWIQSMHDDDVLGEVLFIRTIQPPSETECVKIQDLAKRQLDRLTSIKELPSRQLSTCYSVLSNCQFAECCNSQAEFHPADGAFDVIPDHTTTNQSIPRRSKPQLALDSTEQTATRPTGPRPVRSNHTAP